MPAALPASAKRHTASTFGAIVPGSNRYARSSAGVTSLAPSHPGTEARVDRVDVGREQQRVAVEHASEQRRGDASRWEELVRGPVIQEPEEVAVTFVFLASERAKHLSGVVLNPAPG